MRAKFHWVGKRTTTRNECFYRQERRIAIAGGNFAFFAPQGRHVSPIIVKFGRTKDTEVPLCHARYLLSIVVVVKFFNKNFVRRKVDNANIQTETDIKQSKQSSVQEILGLIYITV